MQRGPNFVAWRMPDHGTTGCGSRQRRSATGGAAKGTPRKIRMGDALVSATPLSLPLSTVTIGSPAAFKGAAIVVDAKANPSPNRGKAAAMADKPGSKQRSAPEV